MLMQNYDYEEIYFVSKNSKQIVLRKFKKNYILYLTLTKRRYEQHYHNNFMR